MVSGSLALLYFLLGFHGGRQGSGPDRGQSPVEWGDFLSIHPSICSQTWLAGPEAWLAGPEAWAAGPEAWQAKPEAWLAGHEAWLVGPEAWLAGLWVTQGECRYGRTDRKSPHCIGIFPLLGPLPKKGSFSSF